MLFVLNPTLLIMPRLWLYRCWLDKSLCIPLFSALCGFIFGIFPKTNIAVLFCLFPPLQTENPSRKKSSANGHS